MQATGLSHPTRHFVHSRARRRLRANTSRRIKRSSGSYHPRRYRLQRFGMATAGCACTPNAKSQTRRLLWTVQEKRFCWHHLSNSAWPWRRRANNLDKTESPSKICMCGVSTQQWPSIQITLFERTVRARGLTLWRHRWQEASEFLYTKTPLLEGAEQPKKSPETPGNALSDMILMSHYQQFAADAAKTKTAVFWNRA